MTKIKNFFKNKNIKLLSVLSTLIILFIVLIIKGIYPFGTNNISSCDMTQSYVTFYHHLYDVFHNGKSLFYSFTLGMGSNTFGGSVVDGFLNPTSWLIALTTRDNILNFMTYIVVAKFLLISLTTSYFIEKTFPKVEKKWQLLGTLLYTFSAYNLINYGNIMWLDIVALFPLLCLGIKQLLEENKITLFTIILACCLANNYNLSYMILFFLLFCVPFAIKYHAKNKRLATKQLILGIILSIGLSAAAFIPSLIQTMSSYRMSGAITTKTENIYFFYKLANILFYSTPIIFSIPVIKKFKDDNQSKIMTLSIITSFLLPLIFERINLQWHTGSYQMFPFRYGFIVNFILTCMMLYSLHKYSLKETIDSFKVSFNKYKFIIASILLIVCSIYFAYIMHNNTYIYQQFCSPNQFIAILLVFIISAYLVLMILKNKKAIPQKILTLNVILITMLSIGFIAPNRKYLQKEYSDETIEIANTINKELNIDEELYRLKDTTYSMTENYPLVSNIPSNSTFLHIISTDQVLNYKELGYANNNTKLSDSGGTIISDTIYGNKYLITKQKLNSKIYKLIKKTDNFYYYENPYTKFIYSTTDTLKNKLNSKNVFDANNILAKEVLNIEKDLLKIKENKCTTKDNKTTCNFELNNEILYLYSTDLINEIKVNNKTIIIPEINNQSNIIYDNSKEKIGIVNLGTYNEKITIELLHDNNIETLFATVKEDEFIEAFSNLEEITATTSKNTLTIKYNNKDNKKGLFIPINYDTGWSVTLNNKKIDYTKKLNNFIYIDLEKGQNNIVLTFTPPKFKLSLIVTIITSLIIVGIAIYESKRKNTFKEIKFITYPLYYLGILIVIVAAYKVYISPIINTFIN